MNITCAASTPQSSQINVNPDSSGPFGILTSTDLEREYEQKQELYYDPFARPNPTFYLSKADGITRDKHYLELAAIRLRELLQPVTTALSIQLEEFASICSKASAIPPSHPATPKYHFEHLDSLSAFQLIKNIHVFTKRLNRLSALNVPDTLFTRLFPKTHEETAKLLQAYAGSGRMQTSSSRLIRVLSGAAKRLLHKPSLELFQANLMTDALAMCWQKVALSEATLADFLYLETTEHEPYKRLLCHAFHHLDTDTIHRLSSNRASLTILLNCYLPPKDDLAIACSLSAQDVLAMKKKEDAIYRCQSLMQMIYKLISIVKTISASDSHIPQKTLDFLHQAKVLFDSSYSQSHSALSLLKNVELIDLICHVFPTQCAKLMSTLDILPPELNHLVIAHVKDELIGTDFIELLFTSITYQLGCLGYWALRGGRKAIDDGWRVE